MKTGAWFYKAIPKYEVPPPSARTSNISAHSRLTASPTHGGSAAYCRAQTAPTTPEPPVKKPIRLRIQCTDTSSDEDESAATDGGWTSEHSIVRDRPSSCKDTDDDRLCPERSLTVLFRSCWWRIVLRMHPLFNRKTDSIAERPASTASVAEAPHQRQFALPPSNSSAASSTVEWETMSISSQQHHNSHQYNGNGHSNGNHSSNYGCNGSLRSRRGSVSSSISMSDASSANSSNVGGLMMVNGECVTACWISIDKWISTIVWQCAVVRNMVILSRACSVQQCSPN